MKNISPKYIRYFNCFKAIIYYYKVKIKFRLRGIVIPPKDEYVSYHKYGSSFYVVKLPIWDNTHEVNSIPDEYRLMKCHYGNDIEKIYSEAAFGYMMATADNSEFFFEQ